MRKMAKQTDMPKELISVIGCAMVEDDCPNYDNLGVVLASYFSDHMNRPDNDPIDDEVGWGEWVLDKSNKAMELIAIEVKEYQEQAHREAMLGLLDECKANIKQAFDGKNIPLLANLEADKVINQLRERIQNGVKGDD